MKNILILGGSYFVGRVFTIMGSISGPALTLINRGQIFMERYGTKEELLLSGMMCRRCAA